MNIAKTFFFAVGIFSFGAASAAPKYQPAKQKPAVSSPNKEVRASGNLTQPSTRK